MTQDETKTGIGLTFILGMLILLTTSFGFALARKNSVIKGENEILAEKVNQLEERVRVLAHSRDELEVVRNSLVAEIEQLRITLSSVAKEGMGNRE